MSPEKKNKSLIVNKLLSEYAFLLRKNTGITFNEGYLQCKVSFFRLLDKHEEADIRDAMKAFFLDVYALENNAPWQLFVKRFDHYRQKSTNLRSVIPVSDLLNKYWKNFETGRMYEEIKDSTTPAEKIIELRVEREKLGTIFDVSLEDVERYLAKVAFLRGKDNVSDEWIRAYVNRVEIYRDRDLLKKETAKAKSKEFLKKSLKSKIEKKEECKKDFQEFFNLYFGFKDPVNRKLQKEIEEEKGIQTIGSKRFKYDFAEERMSQYGEEFLQLFKSYKTLEEYVRLYEDVEKDISLLRQKYRIEILEYLFPEEVDVYE